ncbi:MAG: ADP-ribosylglycohydrolase family protein [Clostridia bacterium]|nr:ADP-ribosylglycohydrolase family protein [Clostridia bacterium]
MRTAIHTSYSVPPAIIAFPESTDYESAIRNAISFGGDADTQACIAGGIAEAYYKEIPKHIKRFYGSRIDFYIKSVVQEFAKHYCTENSLSFLRFHLKLLTFYCVYGKKSTCERLLLIRKFDFSL